ncbi:MAG TPA: indolepyruvate ferredoxin oxidoreductase subunit alpha [Eubacterium sp.]|nr:indolepyruvate ferredoxin oxidoreductase subunit alpha [Eubacterium sp.]HCW38076.1 indolepyruvate ferredoxin oxidoreductase subunit alpha [Eubacterium sp.]
MKELMLGNKAVARGLYEAGCKAISSYPGTPSTEITEEAAAYNEIYCEWAPNEKVALEVAHGATLGGVRAACAMKHVGLNVAADPLFTISYQGLNAGLVVCVADDPGMHSSQNEQDSRHYAIAAKLPMLEPSDSEESRVFAKKAFEMSEKFNTPVLLKMVTRVAHSQSIVDTEERVEPDRVPYVKDPAKVMMTLNSRNAHIRVEERTKALIEYAESTELNRVEMGEDTSVGIITDSTSYQYAREVLGDKVSILKLGMINPLPEKLIKDFAQKVDKVIVLEELDPIIENHCKQIGIKVAGKDTFPICGEFSQNLVRKCLGMKEPEHITIEENVPARPPVMCAGCPHRGIFYILKKKKCMVYGDIGCYTLGAVAPLNAMDLNVCMGASCSGLHGFNKAIGEEAESNSVGVIGDSTFIHSGMTGITDISYNMSNSTVIILDNSITGMTGHQQNPTTGKNLRGEPAGKVDLEALCRALGFNRVRVVDPYDLKAVEEAITDELAAKEPSIIISRRPCVMIKGTVHKPPISVDESKCVGCKQCMSIGCPAIAVKDKKAHIDPTLCIGCKVCSQMCKFEAI